MAFLAHQFFSKYACHFPPIIFLPNQRAADGRAQWEQYDYFIMSASRCCIASSSLGSICLLLMSGGTSIKHLWRCTLLTEERRHRSLETTDACRRGKESKATNNNQGDNHTDNVFPFPPCAATYCMCSTDPRRRTDIARKLTFHAIFSIRHLRHKGTRPLRSTRPTSVPFYALSFQRTI